MPKKCMICGEQARFRIKDTSNSYCEECASLNFADTDYLEKVEEDAERLKNFIKEKIDNV